MKYFHWISEGIQSIKASESGASVISLYHFLKRATFRISDFENGHEGTKSRQWKEATYVVIYDASSRRLMEMDMLVKFPDIFTRKAGKDAENCERGIPRTIHIKSCELF